MYKMGLFVFKVYFQVFICEVQFFIKVVCWVVWFYMKGNIFLCQVDGFLYEGFIDIFVVLIIVDSDVYQDIFRNIFFYVCMVDDYCFYNFVFQFFGNDKVVMGSGFF